jgi:hypothetical protein
MVKELLDQDWSHLEENQVRGTNYCAGPELKNRCMICKRLFDHLQSHIAARHVSWFDIGLNIIGKLLVIEALPEGFGGRNRERASGNPGFIIEAWGAGSSFGPGAAALIAKTPDFLVVPESTGDPHCLSLASKWLDLCVKNHPDCNRRFEAGYCPPRLLRLSGGNIYLVTGSDLLSDLPVRYAALSYCVSCSHQRYGIPTNHLSSVGRVAELPEALRYERV